jgi:GT2 family glycosyltransferase
MVVRVIVLNWNGRRWLEPCLSALKAQTFRDFEVVVVDNASTDGSADVVRQRFPEYRVLQLSANLGFAAGNNAGAKDATATYLAFLNNDTEPDPEWLAALVAAAESDPTVGFVASHIVFMNPQGIVDSAGDGYLRCGGGFKRAHGQPMSGKRGVEEVFGACGAGFLIHRSLFELIGGFDEEFFMVYEDVDLSYRARLAGARVVCSFDAVVRHAGSASLGRASGAAVYYGQRNLEWTWMKNSPRRLLLRSLPSHVLYDLAGLVAYTRAGQLSAWLRGKSAALAGLPSMIRKRQKIQRATTLDPESLWRLMEPDWIGIKRREKAFAFRVDAAEIGHE